MYVSKEEFSNYPLLKKNAISISREDDKPETLLKELKEIVACYEMELPYINEEDVIIWSISKALIDKVNKAETLADALL